ncbi:hypothetical protein MASR2M15_00650 [Anaerolineales bacterium]
MSIANMPINVGDAKGLKNALGQKAAAILILYSGNSKDQPLHDALKSEAKKMGEELLIIKVDVDENPDIYAKYDEPQLPALITFTKAFFGRKEKSRAERIRPADVRNHIAYLLHDTPLPQTAKVNAGSDKSSGNQKPVTVTEASFRNDVLKSKAPVLVDFWAPWCGPCRSIAPYIDQMAEKYGADVKVVKINIDENPSLSQRYQVASIPTFMMFHGGQPIGRLSGANPGAIQNLILDAIKQTS